jgi:hypothetical protein
MNEAAKTKLADFKTEWADTVKGLSPNESDKVLALMPEVVEQAIEEALPPVLDRIFQKMGYSSEIVGLLHLLAAKSNETYEDVLRKALTLYSFALDAKEKGNRLAVLNPEDEIVHEIIGLGASTEPHSVASK